MSASTRIRNKWQLAGWLLLAVTTLGSSAAWAGQSAELVCVKKNEESECQRYELRVAISSDTDTGRTGAFGIGVQLANGQLAYWTLAKGLGAYRGGLIEPVEGIMSALPARREYVVFAGMPEEMCSLSSGQAFDVYAGHGAVPADREAQVQFLLARNIKGFSPDHVRGAFIQSDLHKNPWKAGKVYSQSCASSGG